MSNLFVNPSLFTFQDTIPSAPTIKDRGLTQPPAMNQTQQATSTQTPAATLAELSFEYASIRHPSHCPLGMYVVPSTTSLLIWDGVLFVHRGYYNSSVLKFQLTFPSNYPERPPLVHFITDVFHPLISQRDGLFSLAPRFPSWRPKEHHAFDVLHWIKASFKKQALDSLKEQDCLNKEAFRLYRDSTSSFAALATQSASLSQSSSALYDVDHPSLAGKARELQIVKTGGQASKGGSGFQFKELSETDLATLREQLGLREWGSAILTPDQAAEA